MGTCYSTLIEVQWPGPEACWSGEAFFEMGKSYELARCFPHQGWPRGEGSDHHARLYEVSRAAWVLHDKEFADSHLAWGTHAEIRDLYEKEMREAEARDFPCCRAMLAAAKTFEDAGANVRILIWGD